MKKTALYLSAMCLMLSLVFGGCSVHEKKEESCPKDGTMLRSLGQNSRGIQGALARIDAGGSGVAAGTWLR